MGTLIASFHGCESVLWSRDSKQALNPGAGREAAEREGENQRCADGSDGMKNGGNG